MTHHLRSKQQKSKQPSKNSKSTPPSSAKCTRPESTKAWTSSTTRWAKQSLNSTPDSSRVRTWLSSRVRLIRQTVSWEWNSRESINTRRLFMRSSFIRRWSMILDRIRMKRSSKPVIRWKKRRKGPTLIWGTLLSQQRRLRSSQKRPYICENLLLSRTNTKLESKK